MSFITYALVYVDFNAIVNDIPTLYQLDIGFSWLRTKVLRQNSNGTKEGIPREVDSRGNMLIIISTWQASRERHRGTADSSGIFSADFRHEV